MAVGPHPRADFFSIKNKNQMSHPDCWCDSIEFQVIKAQNCIEGYFTSKHQELYYLKKHKILFLIYKLKVFSTFKYFVCKQLHILSSHSSFENIEIPDINTFIIINN